MSSDDTATQGESTMEVDPSKEASEEMTDPDDSNTAAAVVVVSPEEERKRKTTNENDTSVYEKNDDGTESQGKKTRHGQDTADQEEANDEDDNNDNHHDPNHHDSDDGDEDEDGDESDTEPKSQENAQRPRPPPLRPIKRARTAYFIFTDEKRPLVQAEHPGEGVAGVARIMGQMWSSLSAEEKEKYQQQAALERDRVAKELEEYKAAGGILPEDSETTSKQDHSASSSSLIYPLGRIRKICKLDPEVRGVSKEAMLLITKCAELATAKLGQEAVRVAQIQNRRKLLPDDVAHVCSHREQFLFLKDDIKDLIKETTTALPSNKGAAVGGTKKKGDAAKELAAVGSKPLTNYFASSTPK